jgi:hypothetical protein
MSANSLPRVYKAHAILNPASPESYSSFMIPEVYGSEHC